MSACFIRGFSVICALALGLPELRAQALSPEALAADLAKYKGKQVQVECKFDTCWGGDYIAIVGNALKFHLVDPAKGDAAQDAFRAKLINNKDSGGQGLTSEKSNVVIKALIVENKGQFKRADAASDPLVAQAIELSKALDDVPRFEDLLKARQAKDPGSLEATLLTTREARIWGQRYKSEDLLAWARAKDQEALDARAASIALDDAEACLDLARRFVTLLGDKNRAIAIADRGWQAARKAEDKKRLAEELESLEATYYRSRWVPLTEFYAAEGYVLARDGGASRWMRREAREFELVIKSDIERTLPLRIKVDVSYVDLAKKGVLELYMRPHHVAATTREGGSIGMPKLVTHKPMKAGNENRLYTQWLMPDGSRYYFIDERLFHWYTEKEPFEFEKVPERKDKS